MTLTTPGEQMISVHRKKDMAGKEYQYYVGTTAAATKLTEAAFHEYIQNEIHEGDEVRIVNTGVLGITGVLLLKQVGAELKNAHWHNTDLPKNLKPDQLVIAICNLKPEVFRVYTPQIELIVLNELISGREAIIKQKNAAANRVRAMVLSLGYKEIKEGKKTITQAPEWLTLIKGTEGLAGAKARHNAVEVTKTIKQFNKINQWLGEEEQYLAALESLEEDSDDACAVETPVETLIKEISSNISQVTLLKEILGVTAPMIAATIVTKIGDIDKFATVSKLWRFSGYGINPLTGRPDKLEKGKSLAYDPTLRKTLWLWSSMVVQKHAGSIRADGKANPLNKWNPIYKEILETEMVAHTTKCLDEKKQPVPMNEFGECTHCKKRALRKVVKKALKQYWIEARKLQGLSTDMQVKAVGAVG